LLTSLTRDIQELEESSAPTVVLLASRFTDSIFMFRVTDIYGDEDIAVLQVDISDPDSPRVVSMFGEVFSGALSIYGSTLCVGLYYPDHGTNVLLYDVSGESPRWIGYVPHPYCGLGSFSISGDYAYVVGVPYGGCFENDHDPPITAIVRLSDMSTITQHLDAWAECERFSRIYVPRYDENYVLKSVDVFPLQCE
jgi:hypothetical protein